MGVVRYVSNFVCCSVLLGWPVGSLALEPGAAANNGGERGGAGPSDNRPPISWAVNCLTIGPGLTPAGVHCKDFTLSVDFCPSSRRNGRSETLARCDHNHFGQVWSDSDADAGLSIINNSTIGGYGLYASTSSGLGGANGFAGVTGENTNTGGVAGYGVVGMTSSIGAGSAGVGGFANEGPAVGVAGYTYSNADDTVGIYGKAAGSSRRSYGMFGDANAGVGVYGTSTRGTAGKFEILNSGNTGTALYARTIGTGRGLEVFSGLGTAARLNSFTSGGVGTSPTLQVQGNQNGWLANFYGESLSTRGIYVSLPSGSSQPGLQVVNGSKNAVVSTSQGARALYSEESTEVWFADYGFGRTTRGSVVIQIDPLFAETVNLDEPYHVFVQAYADAELYVSRRTPTEFEVQTRRGAHAVELSYRIVAKRRGFENKHLEPAPWADQDPNLKHP